MRWIERIGRVGSVFGRENFAKFAKPHEMTTPRGRSPQPKDLEGRGVCGLGITVWGID